MEIYKYGLDAWTSEVGVVRLLSLGCVVFPDLRKDWITWKTSEKEHLWACLAQWIKFLGTAHKGLPESDRSHSQAAFMLVGCGSCSGLVFCNGPLLEAPRLDSLGYPGGGGRSSLGPLASLQFYSIETVTVSPCLRTLDPHHLVRFSDHAQFEP